MTIIRPYTVGPILAVDLGKYKSVACIFNRETGDGSVNPLLRHSLQYGRKVLPRDGPEV